MKTLVSRIIVKTITSLAFICVVLGGTNSMAGTVHFNGNFVSATLKGDLHDADQQPDGSVNWICNKSDRTCFIAGPGGFDGYWPGIIIPPIEPDAVSGNTPLMQ